MVKVRVLGKYSPFPKAGGACPGYWVTSGDTGILLECGPGVLSRFGQFEPLSRISVVILSHLHFDHCSDFYPLRYAAAHDNRYTELPRRIVVYAPPEPAAEYSLLHYKDAVEVRPIAVQDGSTMEIEVGPMKVTFHPVHHPAPAVSVRIDDGRSVLTYSGDTRPCSELVEAARGVGLFLCEASAVDEDADYAAPRHLTARQAGQIARNAGVTRLLLTHIWPLYDEDVLLSECREEFESADIVVEGAEYEVPPQTSV